MTQNLKCYVIWISAVNIFLLFCFRGFVNVFDGNYKDGIENFRKVLTLRPANIIAANNVATC